MADGIGGVSQQSLSEIFSKIDKATEQGREVFVNDQGDVRTKGQFKSFFIRLFKPGFQAQQSERIAQAIANAAGREHQSSPKLVDRKIRTLNAETLRGNRFDDYTNDGLEVSGNFRLNTIKVLNRASELSTVANNKNLTTDIASGKPGTYELKTSHETLNKIEDALSTLGDDYPVWTGGGKGGGYTPANDTELPEQFSKDVERQTTKIQGFNASKPGSPDNTPEKLQENLQTFAHRAAGRSHGANQDKAAQALTTVLNQALFSSILPVQEKASYGTNGEDWLSIISTGDTLEFSVSLTEDGNVRIQAEQEGRVKGYRDFRGDELDENVFDKSEELPTHISTSFELSTESLFEGKVSVIPGSLELSRTITVPES